MDGDQLRARAAQAIGAGEDLASRVWRVGSHIREKQWELATDEMSLASRVAFAAGFMRRLASEACDEMAGSASGKEARAALERWTENAIVSWMGMCGGAQWLLVDEAAKRAGFEAPALTEATAGMAWILGTMEPEPRAATPMSTGMAVNALKEKLALGGSSKGWREGCAKGFGGLSANPWGLGEAMRATVLESCAGHLADWDEVSAWGSALAGSVDGIERAMVEISRASFKDFAVERAMASRWEEALEAMSAWEAVEPDAAAAFRAAQRDSMRGEAAAWRQELARQERRNPRDDPALVRQRALVELGVGVKAGQLMVAGQRSFPERPRRWGEDSCLRALALLVDHRSMVEAAAPAGGAWDQAAFEWSRALSDGLLEKLKETGEEKLHAGGAAMVEAVALRSSVAAKAVAPRTKKRL